LATEKGIKTERLPIGEYLSVTGRKVLTVNQVIEILLYFLETKNWLMSFQKVIPQRRNPSAKENKEIH